MRTLVLATCLLVACDAGSKPSEPAPAPTPSKEKWVGSVVKGADLSYLPADSDLVMQIDVATLRRSAMWPAYEKDLAKALLPGASGCEYQPLHDVTSIAIGVPMESRLDTFVFRGIDRDKLLACWHGAKHDWSPAFDGNVVTLSKGLVAYVATFVDGKTLVVQGAKAGKATRATLEKAIAAGAPLAQNQGFAAPVAQLPLKPAVAIVSRPGSAQMKKQWTTVGPSIDYIYGSADASDGLKLQFAMVFKTADEATQLTKMMQSQLASGQVKAMFDKIEARSQDKTAILEIVMSEQKLASMMGMMRGMLMPAD